MAKNGKRPKLELGMLLLAQDGGEVKVVEFDSKTVSFVRRSTPGRYRFTTKPVTLSRNKFWRDVARA